jgi:hypothetical protein
VNGSGAPRLIVRPGPRGMWRAQLQCPHSATEIALFPALGLATPETAAAAARQAHGRIERCRCGEQAVVRVLGAPAGVAGGGT